MNTIAELPLSRFLNNKLNEYMEKLRYLHKNTFTILVKSDFSDYYVLHTTDKVIECIYELLYRGLCGVPECTKLMNNQFVVYVYEPIYRAGLNSCPMEEIIKPNPTYYTKLNIDLDNLSDFAILRTKALFEDNNINPNQFVDKDKIEVVVDARSKQDIQYDNVVKMCKLATARKIKIFTNKFYRSIKIAGTPNFQARDIRKLFIRLIRKNYDISFIVKFFKLEWIKDILPKYILDELTKIIKPKYNNLLYDDNEVVYISNWCDKPSIILRV